MRDVLLDTNVFILYLAGQINPNRIPQYCRNELFTKAAYTALQEMVRPFERLVNSPNILTEVDNILNRIHGTDKTRYLSLVKHSYSQSVEKYLHSESVARRWYFDGLGLTDSAILMMAADCDLLISADSTLCDYARSLKLPVYDFGAYLNSMLHLLA
jgi:hypothetical protein